MDSGIKAKDKFNDWNNELRALTEASPFQTAVYVKRLSTNDLFEHNANVRFPSASIIKLFIFYHLFSHVCRGAEAALRRAVIYDRSQAVPGGILHKISGGAVLRLEDLAMLMLSVSDNTATNILIDELGMDGINRSIQKIGAKDTVLRRKMMDMDAKRAGLDNYTTASDTAKVLEVILKSPRMAEMLSVQKSTSMFPALLPYDDMDDVEPVLAHKTGGLPGIAHDAGIFFYADDPVIAVALTEDPTKKLRNEAHGFCAEIAAVVYRAFAPKPKKPTRGSAPDLAQGA